MQDKRTRRLERVFQVSSSIILIVSIAVALLWILFVDELNLEPYLVLLGLLYAFVPITGRWLIKKLGRDLKRERLTVTYSLAYGYLNNYLAPVVRRLRKELKDPAKLRFIVYIPRFLSELRKDSIDELLVELKNQSYEVEAVELDFPGQKRRKDIRTARKIPIEEVEFDDVKYFDFPTTLLVLEKAVEFKMVSHEDSFPDKEKERLEIEYIREFREQLQAMLNIGRYDAIRKNIELIEGRPDFLEESNPSARHR